MDNSATNGGDKGTASTLSRIGDDDDIVHAIEDALADDGAQFFDVDNNGRPNSRSPLTEEEKEQLQQELKKTEDEISTLRQVLSARLKHSTDLKRRLGITPWVEVQQDISQSFKAVKESTAVQKTGEALHQASDAVSKKFGQLRSSPSFKSFEDRVGTAYNNVKAKIAGSTSVDQLAGKKSTPSTPATQPTSPSMEKPMPPQ